MAFHRHLLLAAALCASQAHANCWLVGDFRGYSIQSAEKAPSADGMTGQTFKITVDARAASVLPGDLGCTPAGNSIAVCLFSNGERATVETWAVDVTSGRVVHTNARVGSGPYTGGRMFVGRVIGSC